MIHPFDRDIQNRIQKEDIPAVPDFVHQMTEATLASLPEKLPMPKRRPSPFRRVTAAAACAALLMLGVLPNISPSYAQAVETLPIIGPLVRVLTIRNVFYDDGRHQLEAEIPVLNDPSAADAAELINADVDRLTSAAISRFYSELETDGRGYGSIHINYETILSSERWFTLKLTVSETAGSSNTYLRYYHIDRTQGRWITFGDLFTPEGYAAMEAYVLDQMAARMAADPEIQYWTAEDAHGEAFTALTDDQTFYFTENGTLVIVYEKYEVASGSMGTPEFEIPEDIYTQYLR